MEEGESGRKKKKLFGPFVVVLVEKIDPFWKPSFPSLPNPPHQNNFPCNFPGWNMFDWISSVLTQG